VGRKAGEIPDGIDGMRPRREHRRPEPMRSRGATVLGIIGRQISKLVTSLGTMIREGAPTYGPSKAALEAFSAIMAKDLAGTGVTVNVLVPGRGHQYPHGATRGRLRPRRDDPACGDGAAAQLAGVGRGRQRNWRRFLAVHWDPSLPSEEAAAKAGAPVAWTDIATMPIEPPQRA
jgi:NAD(P)-dependent dehydrogenase (short-subunit alcohol dehydrogenase family)